MIAVLVGSRKKGKSGYTALRNGACSIRCEGLVVGDLLHIYCKDQDGNDEIIEVTDNGEVPIGEGTIAVAVEHKMVGNGSDVFVDVI